MDRTLYPLQKVSTLTCCRIPKICTEDHKKQLEPPQSSTGTYRAIKPGLILKAVNRETSRTPFVAILVGLRHDGGGLLRGATNEGIERRNTRIGDIHVVCCIFPNVSVIEWLNKSEKV